METELLLLGVDGGGTRCRARLSSLSGTTLGEGSAGPANIRFGLEQSFAAIFDAARQCVTQARLNTRDMSRITACLALAGACEPQALANAQTQPHPFRQAIITTDAKAACIGAHAGGDGGVIVVGTGTIGWAELEGRSHRVGGWGLPLSDEGSGAWLGREALRRVLWAQDSRIPWTGLLSALLQRFELLDVIVRLSATALPRDFAALAPLVIDYAADGDAVAVELMRRAAGHVDHLANHLIGLGAQRLALVGGLAPSVEGWLAPGTRAHLVTPLDDAVGGALRMANAAAQSLAA